MKLIWAGICFVFAACSAHAGDERPAQLLAKAETALTAARTPKERLAALGLAAQAQEAVLMALRSDLRDLSVRANGVDDAMVTRQRRLRAVLSALERIERAPSAATLAHPGGALSVARAGMALSAFAPALQKEADSMRATLGGIRDLSTRRKAAAAEARSSFASLQEMRTEIASLLDRERKTRRLPAEMVEQLKADTEALAKSAANFRALTGALPAPPNEIALRATASVKAAKGSLTPPVEGVLSQPWAEDTEGAYLSVPAYAEVYAPWSGVIRFAGPFGDHGGVVILEPEPGMLMVLGGLGEIWADTGALVLQGQTLGAMGGPAPEADEFLIASGEGSAALGRETLYMEIRENGAPVDPAAWFAFLTEGG